ncbi:Gfo/Idh/MocA family oxidoreductase [Dactylosporangium sp. NPDC000244]|uniref:Gfo/Idh/MocA family protein n=1 Tax=Dactylosporangium sp. NPDC000244 TaxID=3154365 RepID=UPI00331E6457
MRTAVIGLGWAGRSIWLPRLAADPAYAVTAVVDPDPGARAAAVEAHPAASGFATVEELDTALVDLAVVAVPNHLHCDVACAVLRKGIPVFLEKPVCLTSAEAQRLATAEQAGGAVLLAGSAARYRADIQALHGLAGSLGRIRHVDIAWVRARGIPGAGGWFTDRGLAGGGALVDLGWHLFDVVGPLIGGTDFVQVIGTVSDDFIASGTWNAGWRGDAPGAATPPGDVEDTARGFLVNGDGVSVSLRVSWGSHEALDGTVVKVEGSAGTATLRCTFGFSPNRAGDSELTCLRAGEAAPVALPAEPIGTEYDRQLAALPALLADPGNRGRAIDETTRTIAAIERIYASAGVVRTLMQTPAPVAAGR